MRFRPLAAGLMLLAGCSRHASTPAAHPTEFAALLALPSSPPTARLAYGAGPQQFGELRLPAGEGPFPLVVLVHGGCWRSAFDLAHDAPLASALARAGLATWLIEYRRVGDAGGGWPGTFADVHDAVAYVAWLARHYPLDSTRVVLVGHSAGGELALHEGAARAATPDAPRVRAVVSLAGITDLRGYAAPTGCGSAVVPLMGGTADAVPDRYRAASPMDQPAAGLPVRLVHGAADPIVPLAQSQRYVAAAQARGGDASLTVVPAAGHFDLVDPTSAAWPTVRDVIRRASAP